MKCNSYRKALGDIAGQGLSRSLVGAQDDDLIGASSPKQSARDGQLVFVTGNLTGDGDLEKNALSEGVSQLTDVGRQSGVGREVKPYEERLVGANGKGCGVRALLCTALGQSRSQGQCAAGSGRKADRWASGFLEMGNEHGVLVSDDSGQDERGESGDGGEGPAEALEEAGAGGGAATNALGGERSNCVLLKDLAAGGGKGSGGAEIQGARATVKIMLLVLIPKGGVKLPQEVLFSSLQPYGLCVVHSPYHLSSSG